MAEGHNGNGRTMSDEELRELFSAYIDGKVSAEVRAQIELRVSESEELRLELQSLQDLVGGLSRFPDVAAPEGFAAQVMAEVEDMPIPSPTSRGEASASTFDQELGSLKVPLWLKGSIAASLAATLALGFFVLRAPLEGRYQAEHGSDSVEASSGDWGAPMGTGVAELPMDALNRSDEEDAVVSLDPVQEETVHGDAEGRRANLAPKRVSPPQATAPSEPTREKTKASAETKTKVIVRESSRPKASGLKEVASKGGITSGIYEADHEEEKLTAPPVGLVLGDKKEDSEPTEDTDAVADLVGGDSSDMSEFEGFGNRGPRALRRGPIARRSISEDLSIPEPELVAASEAGGGLEASMNYEAGASADVPSSDLVVVSEEQGEEVSDVPSIAAKVAIGTLRVASPGVISSMSAEIVARSWSVQNLTPMSEGSSSQPSVGSQVLQIMVPQGDEENLSSFLSSYGALNTDRALVAAHDGNARLRLTVRWGD